MDETNTKQSVRMPEPEKLLISSSPHIHTKHSTQEIMLLVMLCMVPCIGSAIWYFGWNALRVIVECTAFCVLSEYLWTRIMKQPQTIQDCSAALTGIILALNLPATAPWWVSAVGSVISIIIAKEVFGGLGQNPFNPAAVGRVALLVGFAGKMTTFDQQPIHGAIFTFSEPVTHATDAVTTATPLTAATMASGNTAVMQELESAGNLWQYFIGNVGGSIGETCTIAILIGGIALIALRLIRWQIPASMILVTAVFTWIVHAADPGLTPGPLFHLTTGAMMIGAFFMATDTVTSPLTGLGCFIFGSGIALITCIIRIWGAYPEGLSFAILLMNALVPLIDKFCYKRPFGWIPVHGGVR